MRLREDAFVTPMPRCQRYVLRMIDADESRVSAEIIAAPIR